MKETCRDCGKELTPRFDSFYRPGQPRRCDACSVNRTAHNVKKSHAAERIRRAERRKEAR